MNEYAKHTPGPWKKGKTADSIVSDSNEGIGQLHDTDTVEFYGGFVVAESVASCNEGLIMLAPDMKQWLEKIAIVNCTCDSWGMNSLEVNPAAHDLYCMYRVMTGYREGK